MDLGLRDKVVVVTGGASGIGRATAHAFVHEGARVTALDRDRGGPRATGAASSTASRPASWT